MSSDWYVHEIIQHLKNVALLSFIYIWKIPLTSQDLPLTSQDALSH